MVKAIGEYTWDPCFIWLLKLGADWMMVLGFIGLGLGLIVLSLALQNGARIMLRNSGGFSIMLGLCKMVMMMNPGGSGQAL